MKYLLYYFRVFIYKTFNLFYYLLHSYLIYIISFISLYYIVITYVNHIKFNSLIK